MGILKFINDERFNVFFSVALGIGLVCMFRPLCSGDDCNVTKAPSDKDFDKYVYNMGGSKCFEFKSEVIQCPASGTIEGFRVCQLNKKSEENFRDHFARRDTPIKRCE